MKIFQIFYNEATQAALDPDFIPLNNTESERPDWFEYWPIRKALRNNNFEEDEYIGFFSPRFTEKVGLSGKEVRARVEQAVQPVVSFSHSLQDNVMCLNSFHQAEEKHPGCLKLSQELVNALGLSVNLPALVQDQTRTIFSNYFVAKYSFWKKWDEIAGRIFDLCEEKNNALAERLRASTSYRGEYAHPMKVFIMERVVSLVLELEGVDAEIGVDYSKFSPGGASSMLNNVLVMDALKGQFIKTRSEYFLGAYLSLRKELKRVLR